MNRRSFLSHSARGALAAGASLALPSMLRAEGVYKLANEQSLALDIGEYKILEIICPGGVSQWDNFWLLPDLVEGSPFEWAQYADLDWACTHPLGFASSGTDSPATDTEYFGEDETGQTVHWGPALSPLFDSDEIFSRSRMVTLGHGFDPHELALSLAATGRVAGPRRAGLGTAIQAHFQAVAPRALPYSYVFSASGRKLGYAASYATLVGAHGSAARPIHIKVGDTTLKDRLPRDGMVPHANALLDYYRDRFRERMSFDGEAIRAPGFDAYEAAADALNVAPELNEFLSASLLAVEDEEVCVTPPADASVKSFANSTRTSLRLAAHLLEAADARHACVIDHGILEGSNACYDSHGGNTPAITGANLFNLCREIRALVDATSGPRIDLANTVVAIQTEYSRTRPTNDSDGATGHHTSGFASVLLGGPISGPVIAGGLGDAYVSEDDNRMSHTDVHGALLEIAGADPFASENFSRGDFSQSIHDMTDDGTRALLRSRILGL